MSNRYFHLRTDEREAEMERDELLRQALITQARIILELQHEVRRLKMVEELLEGRS